MRPVDPLLDKQHRHLRSGKAADIGVEVDRPAYLLLDGIECLACRTDLFPGDRDTTYPFGSAFDQAIDVGLAGGAYYHDMIGTVPGRHTHPPQVVFETPGSDLRGNHHFALWIDIIEIVSGGKRYGVFQPLRALFVDKGANGLLRHLLTPAPTLALWTVLIQVLQYLLDIQLFIRRELHSGSSSQYSPASMAAPASVTVIPFVLASSNTRRPAP